MTRLCSMTLLVIFMVLSVCIQLNVSNAAQEEDTWDEIQIVDSPLRPEYERARWIYTDLMSATYLRLTNELSDAKGAYEQVLREHETSAFVHTQLASLSMAIQNVRTAEEECRRAIEIDPEKPTPHFLLGQILVRRNGNSRDKWGDIIAAFQKVVELDPDHIEAHQYLGELAEQMRDYKSAIHSFKELTRIRPYEPLFYLRLGSLHNQLGSKQDAIDAYERAVKINRDLWQGHEALWQLYVEQYQNYEDQLYSQMDLPPDLLEAAKTFLEKAINSYSERCRLAPSADHPRDDDLLSVLWARLGGLYLQFEKVTEAIEILQKILEQRPDHVDANYSLGIAYQALGDFKKAESYLRKTIVLSPGREAAYNALGYLFAEHGVELEEAVELIQKALQKSPENGAYLDSLGWAYFKQGKLEAALAELEKAVRYMPDSAEIRDHLGEVYLKIGLRREAISAWQKAAQLEPDNIAIQEKLKKYQGND